MKRHLALFCLVLSAGFAFEDPFAFYPRPKKSLPEPKKEEKPPTVTEKAAEPAQEEKGRACDAFAVYPLPIQLSYSDAKIEPVPVEHLMHQVKITLVKSADGIYGPKRPGERIQMTLGELNCLPETTRFYESALDAISQAISNAIYKKTGYLGIFCSTSGESLLEIAADGRRKKGKAHGLDFAIEISKCGSVRTISSSEGGDESINTVQTAFIRRRSPVNKGGHLKKERLTDYALYLSRYPDRRVDVEFHPLEAMGEVGLDYILQSGRPWHFFSNISNTGTDTIGQWVASFGFIHSQFILRDSIARLEYASTARFKNYHTVRASYEFPFFKVYRTRFRAHFAYMNYSSTQLGIRGPLFSGRQTLGGGTFLANLHQKGNFFIDGEAGLTFRAVRIINNSAGTDSRYVRFFTPRLGASFEKKNRAWSVTSGLGLVTTINGKIVGKSHGEIESLGAANVTNDWFYLDGYFSTSLFIDSLTRPERGPFAHEIRLIGAGQLTPRAYRLVPQFKGVVGGLNSVRGYPESFISGDTTAALTGEYQIHIPRLFYPNPHAKTKIFGKPFYLAPPRPGLLPSWDLIFKLFVDAGGAYTNRKQGEPNAVLLSTGGGLDLNLMNHLIVRTDLGVVLKKTVGTAEVTRGHTRFSLSATLYY